MLPKATTPRPLAKTCQALLAPTLVLLLFFLVHAGHGDSLGKMPLVGMRWRELDGRRKTKFMEPLVFFWQLIHCPYLLDKRGAWAGWEERKDLPRARSEEEEPAPQGCLAIRSWIVSSPQGILGVLILRTLECDPSWRDGLYRGAQLL